MKNLMNSFKYAINGLKETLVYQKNFRIMILVALIVIGAMFYFPLIRLEKAVLLVMIFSVLILELMNVVIEKIMDFIQPQYNERVKIIKDLSAAIVLIASVGAVIIGLMIFLPYIF